MAEKKPACPVCNGEELHVDRRTFIKSAAAATAAASIVPNWAVAKDTAATSSTPESLVEVLYGKLSPKQKKEVCFQWDHTDSERGLLRTRVANNWHITKPQINSEYFTAEQRGIIREIYEGIIQPEWHAKVDKQLEDDAGGWGEQQNIAIFGQPGQGQFEFVMTGRHMTLRCDGDSADHVAFGGPIFYGHAPYGFDDDAQHSGSVYWHQGVAANEMFEMLDGKQRKVALLPHRPRERDSGFKKERTGISVADLSADQKEQAQKILQTLIEPYRQSDRDEVTACLKAQGGIDNCNVTFYQEGDIGNDKVWDCWRVEGPAFVWYFRGQPHVHVWVNIASDPSVKLNA